MRHCGRWSRALPESGTGPLGSDLWSGYDPDVFYDEAFAADGSVREPYRGVVEWFRGLDAAAMKRLEAYDFPGNVRELENIVERAVALCPGPSICSDDLPALKSSPAKAVVDSHFEFPDDGVDLDRMVYEYERAIVERALQRTGGVRKKAANLLGISFRSLRYRLDKLGFDRGRDDDTDVSDA